MIFEILSKITLDIIRYLSIFVKSRPLQDFDIIRYLYWLLTGFVGIANLSYWLSAPYKTMHRQVTSSYPHIRHPRLDRGSQLNKYEEIRSCIHNQVPALTRIQCKQHNIREELMVFPQCACSCKLPEPSERHIQGNYPYWALLPKSIDGRR